MLPADHRGSICCPPRDNQAVWRAHPRIYLALDQNQQVRCPYCSVIYQVESH